MEGLLPDMSAAAGEESELIEKHEEILARRAELLEQMEARRDQLILRRRRRLEEAEDARLRNASLLQDLQRMEDRLRGHQLPCSQVQVLETRYWASVEESVSAWENVLLGKGSHPTDGPGRPARRTGQRGSSKQEGLPPRPRPRAPQKDSQDPGDPPLVRVRSRSEVGEHEDGRLGQFWRKRFGHLVHVSSCSSSSQPESPRPLSKRSRL